VKLGYAPPRSDLPLLMAARGDKALALAGEIADGLVISNMCPPAFTARAVEIVRKAAAKAGRPIPARLVQYVPCAPGPDGAQARRAIKPALAAMLKQYWTLAQNVASAKLALRHGGIPEGDIAAAVDRIAAGDRAEDILDDRFVDAFTIAGTAEQCRARIGAYARAGVSELALTFGGAQPIADMEYLGRSLTSQERDVNERS
jgi:5,10-methylenetetrahydromethanopterin reductase